VSGGEPAEIEAVDGGAEDEELVVGEVRALEPARPAASPMVLAAAGATAGFTVGAALIALARHHQSAKALKRARRGRGGDLIEVVSSRSFLVDVHLLGSAKK
jgi:hypothetical protein